MSEAEAKITALQEEIKLIQFADALYVKRGKDRSRHANAEFQHRLQEIKSELALLESPVRN